jgi:hypothetical protein
MTKLADSAAKLQAWRHSDSSDYDQYDALAFACWSTMSSAHRDVLRQLMKAPTWDGDIASKSARDDLIDAGLAVRCCFNFEQGYTTATYLAGGLWRIIVQGK